MRVSEGPWTKVGAIFAIIGVYLALAGGFKWFPFESGEAHRSHSSPPSPVQTGTLRPSPPPRTVAYLDATAPTSGGPVGRGIANINGRSYQQSISLQFAESCCGSQQSVTYSVPSGYRELTGALGEQEAPGLPSGYTMYFSISVNGLQLIDNRQVQLGDPAVTFHVSLPATSTTILIDVTADCPNIYCAGNAVVGNARVVPIRTGRA
jgi:hypothetical protein